MKTVYIRKSLSLSFLTMGIFIFCYCANEFGDAKTIFSSISFERTIDQDEGNLKIVYFAEPLGNFTIEEVDVNGLKIDGLPKKADQLIGCADATFRVEVKLPEKKINFDRLKHELEIKTKWQGKVSQESIEKFTLPPSFNIKAAKFVNGQIEIIFDNGPSGKDWDLCVVEIKDEENKESKAHQASVVILRAGEGKLLTVKVESQQIKSAYLASRASLPTKLSFQVVCDKLVKSAKAGDKSALSYTYKSTDY